MYVPYVWIQHIPCSRSTILVVLDKNGEKLDYEPGDHVAIYPQNSFKVVNELIDSLNLSTDPDKPIYVESRRESTGHVRWVQEKRMPVPVTLREAFTYYLDITNPPTPQLLKLLSKQATRPSEQEELNELAKGGDRYEDWKFMRFPSLADVVSQFHSLKLDATLLLQHIPLLQCVSLSILFLSLSLSLSLSPSPLPSLSLSNLRSLFPSSALLLDQFFSSDAPQWDSCYSCYSSLQEEKWVNNI